MHDFLGLGIGLGRFIIILIFGYFTVKWAVKNGVKQAYRDITGKETARQKKNVSGYFVNKNEREIWLIPVITDDNRVMQIDIDGYIDIKPEDIKNIKIKNEDFIYKRITITLNDKTKYVMTTAKKIKGSDYHKENVKRFIETYSK